MTQGRIYVPAGSRTISLADSSPISNTNPYRLCCDDMLLFVLIETSYTFDTQVVRFGRTGREDNLFRISTDQLSDLL